MKMIIGGASQGKIKRRMQEDDDWNVIGSELVKQNPEIVIVTNEVGSGIVPIDAFDRKYREAVGRVCTELAAASEQVDRVICGIGVRIKG